MNNPLLGNLLIIAAASGTGKTSLVSQLVQMLDDIEVSISYTTRAPRPKDIPGKDYHFVNRDKFQQLIKEEAFLEYAEVHGELYGTPRQWVMEKLSQGIDVILEIDWQGALQICQQFGCTRIFLLPPSWEVLEERLHRRNQDNKETIKRRLTKAHEEISHHADFDFLIVNDDFSKALKELEIIIISRRLSQDKQALRHKTLLANLLKSE